MTLEDPVLLLRQLSRHPVSPGRFGSILAHLSDWLSMRGVPANVGGSALSAGVGGPGGPAVVLATRVDTPGGRAATAAGACALLELAVARLPGRARLHVSGGDGSSPEPADGAIVGLPTGLTVARISARGMPPIVVAGLRATGERRTTDAPDLPLPPLLPDIATIAIGPGTIEGGTPEEDVRRAVTVYARALSGSLEMLAEQKPSGA